MKYLDFVKNVANDARVSQADAKRIIESTVKVIREEVNKGEEVPINGLGKFGKKTRSARTGVNPANGKKIEISAKETVVFKAAKDFKDAIN